MPSIKKLAATLRSMIWGLLKSEVTNTAVFRSQYSQGKGPQWASFNTRKQEGLRSGVNWRVQTLLVIQMVKLRAHGHTGSPFPSLHGPSGLDV